MRNKYTIENQIKNMKKKGIKFEIMNEEESRSYLQNNTYFFKIKSYAKVFEKRTIDNQYIHLDFAYLVEMSKLDMYLRSFIMKLSLNCEHFLKVQLLRDITDNEEEDGYSIVNKLLTKYPYILSNIQQKKRNSACADLIYKYENNWAVWNIVEVMSFGDFINLFELYYQIYPNDISKSIISFLWSLKFIRNAAAHNNCLLNSLRTPYQHTHLLDENKMIQPTKALISEIAKVKQISKTARKKKLLNPIVHDFIASLFLFDYICTSPIMKSKTYEELHYLINVRFVRNKVYFSHDNFIMSYYDFVKKVVDYLSEKSI